MVIQHLCQLLLTITVSLIEHYDFCIGIKKQEQILLQLFPLITVSKRRGRKENQPKPTPALWKIGYANQIVCRDIFMEFQMALVLLLVIQKAPTLAVCGLKSAQLNVVTGL